MSPSHKATRRRGRLRSLLALVVTMGVAFASFGWLAPSYANSTLDVSLDLRCGDGVATGWTGTVANNSGQDVYDIRIEFDGEYVSESFIIEDGESFSPSRDIAAGNGGKSSYTLSVVDRNDSGTVYGSDTVDNTCLAPPDTDGDGTPDDQDAFPNDPNETKDSDGDGVGDNADAFPNNPDETKDSDGDEVGDNADECVDQAGPASNNGCPKKDDDNGTPGNNGTLKVHEEGTPSGTESNDPKVCVFNFEGFGFDEDQEGYLLIETQGGSQPQGQDAGPFEVGPADADGYFETMYFNDEDGPVIKNGTYKATLFGKQSPSGELSDEKAKSKVFKVDCEDVPPPPPPAEPENPTVTAKSKACVPPEQSDGVVTVTVTNTDDDTDETVTYEVTLSNGSKGGSKDVVIEDGESATVTFEGLRPGDYTVSVEGDDDTSTSTTVTVEECEVPPPAEYDFTVTPNQGNCEVRTPMATGETEFDASIGYQLEGSDDVVYADENRERPAGDFTVILPELELGESVTYRVVFSPLDDAAELQYSDWFTFSVPANCDTEPPPPAEDKPSATITYGCIVYEGDVRDGVYANLTYVNPTDKQYVFVVEWVVDGVPQAERVDVPADKTVSNQLIFLPEYGTQVKLRILSLDGETVFAKASFSTAECDSSPPPDKPDQPKNPDKPDRPAKPSPPKNVPPQHPTAAPDAGGVTGAGMGQQLQLLALILAGLLPGIVLLGRRRQRVRLES